MFQSRTITQIRNMIDTPVTELSIELGITDEPVLFEERETLTYKTYTVGDTWGELFSCAWVHLTGKVTMEDWENLYLKLDLNGEALLFNSQGNPVKGFTSGSSNFGFMGKLGSPEKRYYPVKDLIQQDGTVDLWIDAGMNDLFGNVKKKGRIETAQIVARDAQIRELYYNLDAIHSLIGVAKKRDPQACKTYKKGISAVTKTVKAQQPGWKELALKQSAELLAVPTKVDHEISAIGHAHLDLAWLWPIRETKRKGARTFANVLRLMEQHDDFIFGASQPQLYQWIKENHPALYEEVKQRIAEGRWEVQGGMWVEADTNVSGEEALVRQMLYGIKFYQEEFGIRVDSLWLPDVFGYSGNMPQIIKKSGLDYFMTIKLSWNDTNKFPHHTFTWEGIDGSEVFAHMPPEGEYNSPANPKWLLKSMETYQERKIDNKTLNLFGVGDGGGGPSASHVERIKRLSGSAPLPKVTMEFSRKFFAKLAEKKDRFPKFSGELYLEKHRGTYTSQGRVKYFNRRMEQKLKTLETLLVHHGVYSTYKQQIEEIWKEVLLYQFHDILPGSSIERVYKECIPRYEILDKQIDAIVEQVTEASLINSQIHSGDMAVAPFNPLLEEITVDHIQENEFRELQVAPLSSKILKDTRWQKASGDSSGTMENECLTVRFAKDGSIASIYDKTLQKEVLQGRGNQFTVYTDIANGWDIFRYYRLLPKSKMKLTKTESFTYGPVQEIVQEYRYKQSFLRQTIRLKPESRQLDFSLYVDWKNIGKMVRTAFPLNLKSDEAIYDIQFGHLSRSTRNDTKVLKAQYEACGQNWVDMNDTTWGAAVITDSKYGYKIKGSTIDLNLIKSTNRPSTNGDIGEHTIRYSLYLHDGDHITGKVDSTAMKFNSWVPLSYAGKSPEAPLLKLNSDQITYSSIKESDDGSGIIIRLYERNGSNCNCTLEVEREITGIYETNMVEENPTLITTESTCNLSFTPFEVKTIKITQ